MNHRFIHAKSVNPENSDIWDFVIGCDRTLWNKHSPIDYHVHKTDKHLLSIAPTRAGKGRGLIIPNLLYMPHKSVLVIDPKGENALVSAQCRREERNNTVFIFNPYKIFEKEFNDRGFNQFQTFNPLANLNPGSPNFVDDIANIAEALIYEESGSDSHWVQAARGYVEFLIMFLVTDPEEQANKTVTLRRLRQIIAGGYSGLADKPQHNSEKTASEYSILERAMNSKTALVQDNAGRYADQTPEVLSLIATAETQTRILKSEVICSALEGEAFDFEKMKSNKISVYLILPSERLITQARYLRLVLLTAMSHFLRSQRGEYDVVMMLDEFSNLGTLNLIANGYGLIAGHGVTLWSFVQNLTQLQHLYPKNWETFIANSSLVTVSNVNDVTTAEYFSRRAGQSETYKITYNHQTNHNNNGIYYSTCNSPTMENNLSITTLYDTSSDEIYLFYNGQAKPTKCHKLLYDLDAPFVNHIKPNPMHVENTYKCIEATQ